VATPATIGVSLTTCPGICWEWTGTSQGQRLRPSVNRRVCTPHFLQAFVGPIGEGKKSITGVTTGAASGPNISKPHPSRNLLYSPPRLSRCGGDHPLSNGHEYTPENTYLDRGKRNCRACSTGGNSAAGYSSTFLLPRSSNILRCVLVPFGQWVVATAIEISVVGEYSRFRDG